MGKEQRFKEQLAEELYGNILPFWSSRVLNAQGGFYGRISGEGVQYPEANRSAILCGRMLWTFSAAYRLSGRSDYLAAAKSLYDYLVAHFIDHAFGGIYWALNAEGVPVDPKKQFYAIAFALYGVSEYARATGDETARQEAVTLYYTIERHAFDATGNGYEEAMTRDWQTIGDVRLSNKDANERRTMNTHLHILEAYAHLYRIWPDKTLLARIANLIGIFRDRIVCADGHLGLFFDAQWHLKSPGCCSYGHDIESSWLLLEAAKVIGDPQLYEETHTLCRRIADAALEGLEEDGSLIYERHGDGSLDAARHWWVQAECVVGLFYLYKYHNRPKALDWAIRCWEYIRTRLIDREGGEWFWSILPDGRVNRTDDKAGFWKCPYHNGRMCMEIIVSND